MSGRLVDRLAQRVDDLVEVLLLADQRRRHRHGIAGEAQQQALVEAAVEDVLGTRTALAASVQNSAIEAGHFRISIGGVPGPGYVVETSTNLTSWTQAFSTNPTALPVDWQDGDASLFEKRFYRVLLAP